MQHLSLEDLARLVDESPTHTERDHLTACERCRGELEAVRAQTSALGELAPRQAPARGWPLLEARLAHEGLLRARPFAARRSGSGARLLRAAAYVGLFLLGGASGLALGRGPAAPAPVANGGESSPVLATDVRTPDGALLRLQEAEALYLEALSDFNAQRGDTRSANPGARLAALEGILLTTRAALEAAPADPLLNGYYLNAVGQRDAVLRQIALPDADPWF